jgi:predicted DNA-binding antitoxin AbrB/MazE fold protein
MLQDRLRPIKGPWRSCDTITFVGQRIRAIYEKGVLRPLSSLPLTESAEVEAEIRLDQDSTVSAPADHLRDVFVAAGLSLPEPDAVATDIPLPDTERRKELARRFSQGRLLSELIIEDREGR